MKSLFLVAMTAMLSLSSAKAFALTCESADKNYRLEFTEDQHATVVINNEVPEFGTLHCHYEQQGTATEIFCHSEDVADAGYIANITLGCFGGGGALSGVTFAGTSKVADLICNY